MNNNLVNVNQKNADVIIDLRYASKNNFTNQKLFKSVNVYSQNSFEYLCKAIDISRN